MNLLSVTARNIKTKKKSFMAPFYGWGLTASRLEPLQRGRLLFTTIVLWAGEIYWATSFCSYLPNIRLQKDKLS